MDIRELRSGDYDELCRLWEEAGLSYRPHGRDRREAITREIAEKRSLFLVAEAGATLIGAVLGTHDGRKGWINRLAVLPAHRGRGIGRALIAEAKRRFLDRGIEIVGCLIEDWNHESMAFFQLLGYVPHQDIVYFSKRRSSET